MKKAEETPQATGAQPKEACGPTALLLLVLLPLIPRLRRVVG